MAIGGRWRTAVHGLAASAVVAGGVLIAILSGGPSSSQIASPGALTTTNGTAITWTRASPKMCIKTTTFDASQLMPQPEALNLAPWTVAASGASPVVTADAVAAPDGTLSAESIAIPTVSGAGVFADIYQARTLTAASYTMSLSVAAPTASTVYIMATPDGVSYQRTACAAGPTWSRCTLTFTATAATWYLQVGVDLRDASQVAQPAQTIYAWGSKLEPGTSATTYVSPQLVSLGNNIPCVEAPGIRGEGTRTNLLLRSQEFDNASWTKSGVVVIAPTVTADTALAPDGTLTADTIALPSVAGAGAASVISQGFTATAAKYSHSVYVRTPSGTGTIYMRFVDSQTVPTQYLGTGSCSVVATSWTRCAISATLTAATWYVQAGVDLRDVSQVTQGVQSLYAWGAQAELAPVAVPTSYIPTAGSTASGAVDLGNTANVAALGDSGSLSVDITPSWNGANPVGSNFVQIATNGVAQISALYEPGDTDVASYLALQYQTAGGSFAANVTKHYSLQWTNTSSKLSNVTQGTSNTSSFASSATSGKNSLSFFGSSPNSAPGWISKICLSASLLGCN